MKVRVSIAKDECWLLMLGIQQGHAMCNALGVLKYLKIPGTSTTILIPGMYKWI